ncbi:di-trans,poly-cis-decaprenylcistransferase [Candidatus Marinamargulisbacteria bacterium SCGC AG-439-L15]|nr:di-trans,poly-cis-decaprenylcistransferase [Candidatus Marinamargulisbacteria bacterium SCGC AG-439-L15]
MNFSDDQHKALKKYNLDPQKMPQHVAIVMDGNGRWAKKRLLPRTAGHKAGRKTLKETLKNCVRLGIPYLSAYVFSTENWQRPKTEVSFLMDFFKSVLKDEVRELNEEGVRLKFLGNTTALSQEIQDGIMDAERETEANTRIQLNIMLNYGAREEIVSSIKSLSSEQLQALTEDSFSQVLYTKGVPDPEVLIRTSGEYRISNFMLWQLAYSELFFIDTLWPNFTMDDLVGVLQGYQKRNRRFGGIINK